MTQDRAGRTYRGRFATVWGAVAAMLFVGGGFVSAAPKASKSAESRPSYRGLLGKDNPKIRRENGKVYIWAGGGPPGTPQAKWYDFTDSLIDPARLQFGIGKDRIRSIDDPLYVKPDDPRLLSLPPSPYRGDPKPKTTDDILVTGVVVNGQARAYPIGLLDYHELVNDTLGGKPVTVGW